MLWKAGWILLALLAAWPAGAEEMTPSERLAEAIQLESTLGQDAKARPIFDSLILPGQIERLSVKERGEALAGAARCAKKGGNLEAAVSHWEKILADPELPQLVRDYAQSEYDLYRRTHGGGAGTTPDAAVERKVAERLRLRKEQSRRDAVEEARRAERALESGELDRAQKHVFEAFRLDPDNAAAKRILRAIQAARPDRGKMLSAIIDFVQTRTIAEYQSLERTLRELEERGRAHLQRGEYEEADRRLRDAVYRIDESDFLELGGIDPGSLATLRERLVLLLEQVHSRAGRSFRSIPRAPDVEARRAGLQGAFFALLARLFRDHEGAESPLRFYTFREPAAPLRPLLASQGFPAGTQVTQAPSALGRARFAERHVRGTIGTGWVGLGDWAERPATDAPPGRRLLDRFGDIVAVEHHQAVHRRIESLAASFSPEPTPMIVEVAFYAAGPGGVVRLVEALGLRAGPRATGLTLVQRDALLAECVKQLEGLEHLTRLGDARLEMRGTTATRLAVEQATADHPALADLAPPPLRVPAADAAYGLTLDVYAEDLAEATAGLPRTAVSLVARARLPTHTVVVPRRSGPEMPYARLPRLAEQQIEVDLELPHFATLVLLGLPNPFATGADSATDLVALVGIRRDDEVPDPPAPGDGPRLVPAEHRHQDHELGPLATEVEDHLVLPGWPEHRSADVASLADRRVERNRYLAGLVGRIARLEGAGSVTDEPVVVHEGRVSGALLPEAHERVAEAIRRLRGHENDLYRVQVDATVVPEATVRAWAALPGVRRSKQGHLRIGPEAGEQIVALFEKAQLDTDVPHWTDSRVAFARATERVGIRQLSERSLLADVRTETLPDGGTRVLPVHDQVHDGWLVEVRPHIESDEGLREVTVRARAARLLRIDRLPHPTAPLRVDVPAWYEDQDGPLIDRKDTPILGDRDGYLMSMPFPGDAGRRFVVLVWVVKIA